MTEPIDPQPIPEKKLFRSKQNRMIGGVCAGFAEYLNLDPVLIRIVWIVMVIWGGIGFLAYLAGLILMPENPAEIVAPRTPERRNGNSSLIWGVLLILFGLFFLSDEFNFWDFHWFFFWPRFFQWHLVWPILIIFAGIIYIILSVREHPETIGRPDSRDWMVGGKRFYRVTSRKMISGVCAGVAEYFNIDVVFVRLGWVILTILAHWFSIISYVILAIVLPAEFSIPPKTHTADPANTETSNSEKEDSL